MIKNTVICDKCGRCDLETYVQLHGVGIDVDLCDDCLKLFKTWVNQPTKGRVGNKFIVDGVEYSINELASKYDIKYRTLWARINVLGWDIEDAIATRPLNRDNHRGCSLRKVEE